jgi:hypothetical protein
MKDESIKAVICFGDNCLWWSFANLSTSSTLCSVKCSQSQTSSKKIWIWWRILGFLGHCAEASRRMLGTREHHCWQYFHTWINGHAGMSLGKYWKTENLMIFMMCDPWEQEYMCWARLTHWVWSFQLLYYIWKGKQDCSHIYPCDTNGSWSTWRVDYDYDILE